MPSPRKCPKCGGKMMPPTTIMVVCEDPEVRDQIPLPVTFAPGKSEGLVQLYRCKKCGHVETVDPMYDLEEPLG